MHDFLHVRETCRGTDLLEGVLDLVGSLHFTFHLLFEELAPHLLDHVVFLHLELVRVLVLVSCSFGNFLLAGNAIHSSLESLLLVLDGFIE